VTAVGGQSCILLHRRGELLALRRGHAFEGFVAFEEMVALAGPHVVKADEQVAEALLLLRGRAAELWVALEVAQELGQGEVGAALHPALEMVLFRLGRDAECCRAGKNEHGGHGGGPRRFTEGWLGGGESRECGEGNTEPEPVRFHARGAAAEGVRTSDGKARTQRRSREGREEEGCEAMGYRYGSANGAILIQPVQGRKVVGPCLWGSHS
jgi:hypothetical protein